MKLRTRTVGTVAVISLSGELDGRSTLDGDQVLDLIPRQGRALLDFTDVSYLNSRSLRILLLVYRHAQASGSQVALVGLSERLRSVLLAVGFLSFFVVAADVATGVAPLTNSPERVPRHEETRARPPRPDRLLPDRRGGRIPGSAGSPFSLRRHIGARRRELLPVLVRSRCTQPRAVPAG